jgi:hypothetical protein
MHPVNRRVVTALSGPGAFALAAFVGGRTEPGYRPRDEPISALAAHGTTSAPIMVPGFLGLAAGQLALARALRGTTTAPKPLPALIALAGLTTAGAGLARNSDRTCPTRMLGDTDVQPTDDAHAAFSFATFSLWIALPFVAAARARQASPSYRRRCRQLGILTAASLIGGGLLARRDSDEWSGTAQRVFLASAFAWFPLAAAAGSD